MNPKQNQKTMINKQQTIITAKAIELIEILHFITVLHHSVRFSTMFLLPLPSLLFYSFSVLLVLNIKLTSHFFKML